MTLSVSAVGVEPLLYEWKKDGNSKFRQRSRTLTIRLFSPEDQGIYTCIVKDKKSQMATEPAALEYSKIKIISLESFHRNRSITVKVYCCHREREQSLPVIPFLNTLEI